jgi:hypothetical protein
MNKFKISIKILIFTLSWIGKGLVISLLIIFLIFYFSENIKFFINKKRKEN